MKGGGLLRAAAVALLLACLSVGAAGGPVARPRAATGFTSDALIQPRFPRPRPTGNCSHLGDAVNTVAARAYLATTVFEGKARSRSGTRRGLYSVTFVVQKVNKDLSGWPRKQLTQVRLQFREKRGTDPPPSNPPGLCLQSYNYTSREPVRANIKDGGKYIVFVTGVGPHNFSLLGEPVFRSRKNIKAVQQGLNRTLFQEASVSGLQNTTVKMHQRLRLKCRSKGTPLPAISWYKNGESVKVSSSVRIIYKKKRSSLEIRKAGPSDGGRYECRATSVTGARFSSWATVTVQPVTDNSQ